MNRRIRFSVFILLALCASVPVQADTLVSGGTGILPSGIVYTFSGSQAITQGMNASILGLTYPLDRVDFLIGGNGQGTVTVELFLPSFDQSSQSWNLALVGATTFNTPNTGGLASDAVLMSLPLNFTAHPFDPLLLVFSASGGVAFVPLAQNILQPFGGVGQTHSTTLPITDPNQGTILNPSPINFQLYAVPEPGTLVLMGAGLVGIWFKRRVATPN